MNELSIFCAQLFFRILLGFEKPYPQSQWTKLHEILGAFGDNGNQPHHHFLG